MNPRGGSWSEGNVMLCRSANILGDGCSGGKTGPWGTLPSGLAGWVRSGLEEISAVSTGGETDSTTPESVLEVEGGVAIVLQKS